MKKSRIVKIIKEELTAVLKEEGYFGPSQGTEEEAIELIAQEQKALLKKLKAAAVPKKEAFKIIKKAEASTLRGLADGSLQNFGAARKHMQSFFPSKNQISKPDAASRTSAQPTAPASTVGSEANPKRLTDSGWEDLRKRYTTLVKSVDPQSNRGFDHWRKAKQRALKDPNQAAAAYQSLLDHAKKIYAKRYAKQYAASKIGEL